MCGTYACCSTVDAGSVPRVGLLRRGPAPGHHAAPALEHPVKALTPMFRNLAIGLIRLAGVTEIKRTLEHIAAERTRILALLAVSRP